MGRLTCIVRPVKPTSYRVPLAVIAPVVLVVATVFLAIAVSPWSLVAVPFILLGSLCAAPNMNLANGLLAIVAILLGIGVAYLHREVGSAIVLGTVASWFLSSLEKRWRAIPVYDDSSQA